jgi:hypothetical protein
MKKLMIIACVALSNVIQAQKIEERLDEEDFISLLTSNVLLDGGENFSYASAGSLIPKDTLLDLIYVLNVYYKTPNEILLDSTAVVEIRFTNGDLFTYNYSRDQINVIQKDSMVMFHFLPSFNCLNKMTNVPISEISFITSDYVHKLVIEDNMKLQFPKLANLLIENCRTEYTSILKEARNLNAPAIVFDSRGNKNLDKKYYGKYKGEWKYDNILYNFDLYIKSDTSYINWFVINDPNETNTNRIKTQVLNVSMMNDNNVLVLEVCYEATKADYTNGTRIYFLNLSQNGKVLYGNSAELHKYYGEMYAIKIKKYKK